jgi:hypothetical protein
MRKIRKVQGTAKTSNEIILQRANERRTLITDLSTQHNRTHSTPLPHVHKIENG